MYNSCNGYQNASSCGCSSQNIKPSYDCSCNQKKDKFSNCQIVKICSKECEID